MTDMVEIRAGVLHDTTVPRRIVGTVVVYDTETQILDFRERIMPEAFGDLTQADVLLNWRHRRGEPIARTGAGLELRDSSSRLELTAMLPNTTEAADMWETVKHGTDRGLSVEMKVLEDSWQGNIRTIHRAKLLGIGVVTNPQYDLSTVEARARGGGRGGLGRESFLETKKVFSKAHGWISLNQAISCECRGGSAEQVLFEEGALDDMVSGARPTMAILGGGFESAVASTVKKTLRFTQQKGRVVYDIDLPDTRITRDLLAQSEFVDFYARPLIDDAGSKSVVKNGVRHYEKVNTRALLVKPTHANQGWEPVTFGETRSAPLEPVETRHQEKEFQIWL